jgi:hypothetical protein
VVSPRGVTINRNALSLAKVPAHPGQERLDIFSNTKCSSYFWSGFRQDVLK